MDDIYSALAPFYDAFNRDLDYAAWADFIEDNFRLYRDAGVHSVLDLGCGTGSMLLELASRGYDMTGVDGSDEMLNVARDRLEAAGLTDKVLLLCQDLADFELYGTVDAIVCCLDTVNHLTDPDELDRCFHWVHNYLEPNGIFLFDVNTPYKFENIYDCNDYILEDEGVVCNWRNYFDDETEICHFDISLFTEDEDGRYTRTDVSQEERKYTLAALRRLLKKNGLELLSVSADYNHARPTRTTERYYIAARAVKEN